MEYKFKVGDIVKIISTKDILEENSDYPDIYLNAVGKIIRVDKYDYIDESTQYPYNVRFDIWNDSNWYFHKDNLELVKEIDLEMWEDPRRCLCKKNYTDDVCIIKNNQGKYELQFWGYKNYENDGYTESDYICMNSMEISYCPICRRNLYDGD